MKFARDLDGACLCPAGSVLTIGAFDGLHRGHQALIQRVCEQAEASQLSAALVSFEPLPREYFKRESLIRILPAAAKLALLQRSGLDLTVLLRFNAALAALSAREFVERVLVRRLAAREVWVGHDFAFGRGRSGTFATLQELGAEFSFAAYAFPRVDFNGERVSSRALRKALLAADFAHAAALLGRPYSYSRSVIRGKQLGRTLGFPTANLPWPQESAQMSGIYAVWVSGAGLHRHPAVASLGTRPTVAGIEPLLEVHLLDFDGDLYGQRLEVEFVAKQREEWHLPSLEALKAQIALDAQQARAILGA